jgi:hypothetical protein
MKKPRSRRDDDLVASVIVLLDAAFCCGADPASGMIDALKC